MDSSGRRVVRGSGRRQRPCVAQALDLVLLPRGGFRNYSSRLAPRHPGPAALGGRWAPGTSAFWSWAGGGGFLAAGPCRKGGLLRCLREWAMSLGVQGKLRPRKVERLAGVGRGTRFCFRAGARDQWLHLVGLLGELGVALGLGAEGRGRRRGRCRRPRLGRVAAGICRSSSGVRK